MNFLSQQSSSMGSNCRRQDRRSLGFSTIEMIVAMVIILIIAAMAFPIVMSSIYGSRLRGAGNDFASLLQQARTTSILNDTYYSSYVLAGPPVEAYVDLTGNLGTGVAPGDPVVEWPSEVSAVAAGGAPNTPSLKSQFLPSGSTLTPNDGLTTPVVFSARGLPCTAQKATIGAVSKTVCDSAGGATCFWTFFQDAQTQAWEAITVSPAGRIRRWEYNGSAWSPIF